MKNLSDFTEEQFRKRFEDAWKTFVIDKNITPTTTNLKGYILGGQPGAGKSTLRNQILEQNSNFIILDADECKRFHPRFDYISKFYPEQAHDMLKQFSGRLKDALTKKALEENYNVIIETTFRDPNVPITILSHLKNNGYETNVSIQTCDKKISWNSCLEREKSQKRHVDKTFHDNIVKNLAINIATTLDSGLIDNLQIYERNSKNENILRYDLKQSDTTFEPKIVDNILQKSERERIKIFSKFRWAIATVPFALGTSSIANLNNDIMQEDIFPTPIVQKADAQDKIEFGTFTTDGQLFAKKLQIREDTTLYSAMSHVVYNSTDKMLRNNPERTEIEEGLNSMGYYRVDERSFDSGLDTALFVNSDKKEIVIGVRGTDPDQGIATNPDVITADRKIAFSKLPTAQTAHLIQQTQEWVSKYKGYKVVMTGHSLGGGLTGIAKLAMPETIHEAYTLNSADYKNLDFKGSDIKDFSPEVQQAIVNFNINKNNPEIASKIFNSHANIVGSFTEAFARTVSKGISNPDSKVGTILRIPASEHGSSSTLKMQQMATILTAATGGKYSDNEIYNFIKRPLVGPFYNYDENSLSNDFMGYIANQLGIAEKNSYLKYNAILQKAKSGEFKITNLRPAPYLTQEYITEAVKTGKTGFSFDNNMTIQKSEIARNPYDLKSSGIVTDDSANLTQNEKNIKENVDPQEITTSQNAVNGIKLGSFDNAQNNDDYDIDESNIVSQNSTMQAAQPQDNTSGISLGTFDNNSMQNDDYDVDENIYENSVNLTNTKTEEEKLATKFKEYLASKLAIAINAKDSGHQHVNIVLATKEDEKNKNELVIMNLRRGGYGDGTYPLHEQISPKDGSYPYHNQTKIAFTPDKIKNTDEAVKIILDEIIEKDYSVENFTQDELKIIQNELSKTEQNKENNDENLISSNSQDNMGRIKFGSFNNQEEWPSDYDIPEEPSYSESNVSSPQSEPKNKTENNDDNDLFSPPPTEDSEAKQAQNVSVNSEEEVLGSSAFCKDTTQNPLDKEAFDFSKKRNATDKETQEFYEDEASSETNKVNNDNKQKDDTDNNDDSKPQQRNAKNDEEKAKKEEMAKLSAEYFIERDKKKLEEVSKGRFPFSQNMLNLTACVNNQIATMNIGNSTQYGLNQAENCFARDIEASKKAVEKSKQSLEKFTSIPVSGLFPFALLIHIIKSAYEEHKQLKYQVINYMETQELIMLNKMSPEERYNYFKQKTLLNGKEDFTTNAYESIDGFKKDFDNDIKENLDSAAKFSSNGRFETSEDLLKYNFLDEKLDEDQLNELKQTNQNDFKDELFKKGQINTQADKISLEICNNLQKIYNVHEDSINKNINFLESQCRENLHELASDDKIFEANKLMTDKIMSQIQMNNEEAKKEVSELINIKLDDFHRKFRDSGELDFDRLEKSINEKAKVINPKLNELGKFVIQAIDHERLTNNANTKYFLKDMGAISKIHDSLSKIDFFKQNIQGNKDIYKNMFEAIRNGNADKLSLIIDTMPFNKSAYGAYSKIKNLIRTNSKFDYEENKLMLTHLLPARLNFLKLYFNDGKENIKNPNFDLMSVKTSDELRQTNKISKRSVKDLINISSNPFKYLFASNINLVEEKVKFTNADGDIIKNITKPMGGVVAQKMDNSLPVNDPHRIVGTLLSAGHTPQTLKNLAPSLDKIGFAKNIDLKALTRIFPALKELEKHGIDIKRLDFRNANAVSTFFKNLKDNLPKPTGVLSTLEIKQQLYDTLNEALKSKSFRLWDNPDFAIFNQKSDYLKSTNMSFKEIGALKQAFGVFVAAKALDNIVKKTTPDLELLDKVREDYSNTPKMKM